MLLSDELAAKTQKTVLFVQEKQPPPATLSHSSKNIYISFVN